MGTYEDLKNAIADVIYTNGNNEITGIVLQQILQRVVSTIGINATFAGIATPDTDPGEVDQNVIYVATQPGIYDNFNGQNITSGIGIFSNKNGVWEYMDLGLQTNLSKSVTYAELVTLRNNGNLTPGTLYRITDYTTTTTQVNTQSAGHPFDVIVLALSESKLSEQAWAVQSARDTDGYFANSKLSAWKIWYCPNNDSSRFAWADATNGKGVIYRMIDEYGNECPYDFKNIKFTHPNDTTTYPDYYYTFSLLESSGIVTDYSLSDNCYNNVIKEYINSNKITINRNIFINTSDASNCNSNSFGNGCYNNSFGNECFGNSFGTNCYNNSFRTYCYFNSFGNGCYSNTFNDGCIDNSFGNGCRSNAFDYGCSYNSFESGCESNTFSGDCSNNSFGFYCSNNSFKSGCNNNSFGNGCYDNSFGTNCSNNSFGNYCAANSFGIYCSNNSFGIYCSNNSFGNYCAANSFGNYCRYNSFRTSASVADTSNLKSYCSYIHFDDGCSYDVVWNDDTTSSNNALQNINVNRGVSGNYSAYNFIQIETINSGYEIQVSKNSSGVIKIFCLADLIA